MTRVTWVTRVTRVTWVSKVTRVSRMTWVVTLVIPVIFSHPL